MPKISSFYGVDVYMYYNDHLPPHFHACHSGDEVLIAWGPLRVYRGQLSASVLKQVLAWAAQHAAELDDNGQRARAGQPLAPIPPLP